MKLDLSKEYKTKETCSSHLEEIRAKLNKRKSEDSKAVASNTIKSFFKQNTELTDNHMNNQTEEFRKNESSTDQLKCIKTMKVNDEQNTFFEPKQEYDEKIEFNIGPNVENTELTVFSVDDSNDKNLTDENCLNVITNTFNNEEDKINSIHDPNVYQHENIPIDDIDCSPKINTGNTNVDIEVDTSIAPKDRKCVLVETSIDLIKQKLKNLTCRGLEKQKIKTRFYATIDPNKNQQAENELSREISKDMFSRVSRSCKLNIFSTCIFKTSYR